MKKILSAIITAAIVISTVCTGIITVSAAEGDVILTVSDINTAETTATVGDNITIAKKQKAVFNLNITAKETYDVIIDDITEQTFRTLNYSVSINYGSGDVIKLNNVQLQKQPGWITFQAGTTSMTITNNGDSNIVFSQVKLTKKVFASDKPIVLPTINYDADGAACTTTVGDLNGSVFRFVAGTNLQRMNVGQNHIIPYYINLEEAGDYYFFVSEKVNKNPRFIVSLNGVQKFATDVIKSNEDRESNYSNLHYVNSIALNKGYNKIDIKVQAYAYINGFILIKKDAVKNVVGTDMENMITAYNRDADLYGGWTLTGSNNIDFYGNSSISFATGTELEWVVDVKRAGNYDIDFIGNYSGTNKFDFVVDGITPYVVNFTGNNVTGETLATQSVELSKGLHTFVIRNYTPGVFNGLNFRFADKVDNVTLKASEFNLADGQGDIQGTFGGYYDTTPDKMDAEYYIAAYSPCEFRHPGNDASIDEAIMLTDEWMKYNVFVTEEGWYNVTMNVASEKGADVAKFEVSANNTDAANSTTESTGWNDLKPLSVGRVYLKSGNNTVRVKNLLKGTNFFSDITFSYVNAYGYEFNSGLVDNDGFSVQEFELGKQYRVFAYANANDDATLYVAGYDEDGELIKMYPVVEDDTEIVPGKVKKASYRLTVAEEDGISNIKAFLWNSDYKALCKNLDIKKAN